MRHARYVQITSQGKLQVALASDSIVIFDNHAGALTARGRHNIALDQAQKLNRKDGLNKGYVGYIMYTGSGLMTSYLEQRKLFPTGVEFIALCAEVNPTHDFWRHT